MLAGERACLLRGLVVTGCLLRIVLRRPTWNSLLSSVSQKYCAVIILSEVSQTKTDITWCHLCAESKKKKKCYKRTFYKTEIDPQTLKLWLPKGKGEGGNLEFGLKA